MKTQYRVRIVPKAASSRELPWPITAVSIRLISGPHIHSPVAGAVNFTISLIWYHMLWFSNPSLLLISIFISSSFFSSSQKESEAVLASFSLKTLSKSSWLGLMEGVTSLLLDLIVRKLGGNKELGKLLGEARDKGDFLERINDWERNMGSWVRKGVWEEWSKDWIFIFLLGTWIGKRKEKNIEEKGWLNWPLGLGTRKKHGRS